MLEEERQRGYKFHPRPLATTILGNIFNLRKDVIAQRDDIQSKYDELEANGELTFADFEDLAKRYEGGGGTFPVSIVAGDADRRAAAVGHGVHNGRRNGSRSKRRASNDIVYVSDISDSDASDSPPPKKKAKLNGGRSGEESGMGDMGSYYGNFKKGASGSSRDPVVLDSDEERDYYGRKR